MKIYFHFFRVTPAQVPPLAGRHADKVFNAAGASPAFGGTPRRRYKNIVAGNEV